jgi:hypothetical protein
MVTRRGFVLQGVAATLFGSPIRQLMLASKTLRVGTAISPDRTELSRGLAFGAQEAERSASLFGWRLRCIELDPAHPEHWPSTEPDAVILASPLAPPKKVVVLRLDCGGDAQADGSLRLAKCPANQTLWDSAWEKFGAAQLNARYLSATTHTMSSDAWLGWLAFKILIESAMRAESTSASVLEAELRRGQFDGHKGEPLRFDAKGQLDVAP